MNERTTLPAAEQLYLLGAEMAQQGQYDAAVENMTTALAIDASLHYARFQLGLLHLTMKQPQHALEIWGALEHVDVPQALKLFKHGLEALIRDDFPQSRQLLEAGIAANDANAPLNRDMQMLLDKIPVHPQTPPATAMQVEPSKPGDTPAIRTDFTLYSTNLQ